MYHKNAALGDIHKAVNWVVADEAARLALSVSVDDLYKICWQIDTGLAYILTDDSPMTWGTLGSGSGTRYIQTCLRSGSQALPAGVANSIIWTSEDSAVPGAWSATVNPTRITVPAGFTKIRLAGTVQFDTNTSGNRGIELYKNNAIPTINVFYVAANTIGFNGLHTESPWLNVIPGDYFELRGYSSVAVNAFGVGSHASFRGCWFEAEFRE